MSLTKLTATMPDKEKALPGRDEAMPVPAKHFTLGTALQPPFPKGIELAQFGMGCFWGAERRFWLLDGIYTTAVGYAAGYTPNPTYQEVCSGQTGHNEVVLVAYDPSKIEYQDLLTEFWQSHNPTQGMRQGNDKGTQYRSGIYFYTEQQKLLAQKTREQYQDQLNAAGFENITTEIKAATSFYYAEEYHQQYLAKNPGGYCGLGGTGISFEVS